MAFLYGHVDCVELLLAQPSVDINAKAKVQCYLYIITLQTTNEWHVGQLYTIVYCLSLFHVECAKLLSAHRRIDINAETEVQCYLSNITLQTTNNWHVEQSSTIAYSLLFWSCWVCPIVVGTTKHWYQCKSQGTMLSIYHNTSDN